MEELKALVAALTPSQASALVRTQRVDDWCEAYGIPWSKDVQCAVANRSYEREEKPPPPPPDPRRKDTVELQQFVAKCEKLPSRVRQVATLCLERGLTLKQCAAELGIKRETVRVHLRRLRAQRKISEARKARLIV